MMGARRVVSMTAVMTVTWVLGACAPRGDARVADSLGATAADTASAPPAPAALDTPPLLTEIPAGADSLLGLLVTADSLLDRYATREYGYEERGLQVFGVHPRAYLVATRDSSQRVWIPATARDSLLPLAQLLLPRLNYLTLAWDGQLRLAASSSAALVPTASSWRTVGPDRDETPARVLQTTTTNGQLWLEVEVLSSSGCDGEDPTVRATGWIPAWGAGRAPTAWFYSRGC